jgi:hypothetical protein
MSVYPLKGTPLRFIDMARLEINIPFDVELGQKLVCKISYHLLCPFFQNNYSNGEKNGPKLKSVPTLFAQIGLN